VFSRRILSVIAIGAAASAAVVGCANNTDTSGAPTQSSASSQATSVDQDAAKLVPEKIKSAGHFVVGTDLTYAPNEYKDANGNAIGWEVDFLNAVAAKLGLTVKYQAATFDTIIPGITGGKYDIGLSSFFDTAEREKVVDMVNYYTAGIQWAAAAGKTVDPNNACGLTVAAQNGTTEILDDLPAKNKACTDAGKPEIKVLGNDTQDDATNAVILGRAEALTADAPVTNYAIKQTDGKLVQAGPEYDKFLYGLPVAKTSGTLKDALQKAIVDIQKDGEYDAILNKWGVESGKITDITINGAGSSSGN
jgi:polar amino acid transport system substrate-binding protein